MFELRDATAIVTGASRGIGPHICAALGQRGVRLAVIARSSAELHAVAARLWQSGITATPIPADLTDDAALGDTLVAAKQALGHIDILVNNAGPDALGTSHTLLPARIDDVLP
jgi:NADP-dependent 3-hydroxy acid dehydrogenase YdfG